MSCGSHISLTICEREKFGAVNIANVSVNPLLMPLSCQWGRRLLLERRSHIALTIYESPPRRCRRHCHQECRG